MKRGKRKIKRILGRLAVALLLAAGIADAVRYLRPADDPRIPVQSVEAGQHSGTDRLIFVYNAAGGFYPGLVDVVHKQVFPATYPCNLCMHAFGTLGPRPEWKRYLASLPYRTEAFHKDAFPKKYAFAGPFPAVFIGNDSAVAVLLTAVELNTAASLTDIIRLLNQRLQDFGISQP